ncbi:uncharacterized protein JN550_008037 [Neoarthrinium moseri]|uniref:uncharacterized protein n=1 Tax=Neoarthrinium moseri TaxID=1658444 RepID=UPI001FDC0F09|nr:uncharacterized protein JN550_008037 [Neoarthrinium moseri]KAI1866059.1 hypothetical protein JN550_008037 [Neoarthrinium moseri]
MLTQDSKTCLFSGIDPQDLDPTIRDSVKVTQELGFRFLWVDALCIFQDDDTWKTRELEIMGQIYRNATFTIVASWAEDVKNGFCIAAYQHKTWLVVATDNPNPPSGSEWKRVVRSARNRYYSGRLQFAHDQTTWICYCSEPPAQECDGWLAGTWYGHDIYSDDYFEDIMTMVRSKKDSFQTKKVLWNWYALVKVYSNRKLRYCDDRLPAISALAREFASILGDRYICGLWKSDLPFGLMWLPRKLHYSVSGGTSGPSWSWASYDGETRWWVRKHQGWRPDQDFEILGSVIELTSPGNPFGKVKAAELHVRGLLLPPIQYIEIDPNEFDGRDAGEALQTFVSFDYNDDPRVQPDSGFSLSFLVVGNREWSRIDGLVVLEEAENRYSRVGCFRIMDLSPMTPENISPEVGGRLAKSHEELRACLRILWGVEHNVRQFVLI